MITACHALFHYNIRLQHAEPPLACCRRPQRNNNGVPACMLRGSACLKMNDMRRAIISMLLMGGIVSTLQMGVDAAQESEGDGWDCVAQFDVPRRACHPESSNKETHIARAMGHVLADAPWPRVLTVAWLLLLLHHH
jgi:hypothetical protein